MKKSRDFLMVLLFIIIYFKIFIINLRYFIYICTQYASKVGKFNSDHRTEKGQFSFQSLRKAVPKNAQTTAQLHSSHTLVR